MRLVSQDSGVAEDGGAGIGSSSSSRVRRMTLRRSSSLSEVEQNRRSLGRGNGIRGSDDKKATTTAAAIATPRREGRKSARGDGGAATVDENGAAKRTSLSSAPPRVKDATLPARRGARTTDELNGTKESGGATVNGGGGGGSRARAVLPPPPEPILLRSSAGVSLGVPVSQISPLLPGGPSAASAAGLGSSAEMLGAEAVVRDCLYNSHGMVALDGYLWKPGALRLVRRWMMLVDNTLYYFIKPG